jgi:hypothetical protein
MKSLMNKLFLILGICALSNYVMAQGSCTISPVAFGAADRITLTFDLTGTNLENVSPVYLWAWTDAGDAKNGDWTNSKEEAKMTQPDPTKPIWTKSFVPKDYYGYDEGSFSFLGCLAKAKSGAVQPPLPGERKTNDFKFDVIPAKFKPLVTRTFPKKVSIDDQVTILYDRKLDTDSTSKTKDEADLYVYMAFRKIGAGNYSAAYPISQDAKNFPQYKMVDRGNGIYSLTFIPKKILGALLRPGESIDRLNYTIRVGTGQNALEKGTKYEVSIVQ